MDDVLGSAKRLARRAGAMLSSFSSASVLTEEDEPSPYRTLNSGSRDNDSISSSGSLTLTSTAVSSTYIVSSGSHDHCHLPRNSADESKHARRKLIIASTLCLAFMLGEALGGYFAGSLAVLTDAAHLLTDFASFMISLFSIWLASRPPTKRMSFGWHRAEVIGALTSVIMIWLITGVLVYEAVQRIRRPEQYTIDAKIMLITAGVGVAFNIIMGISLHDAGGHHHHGHSNGGHDHNNRSQIRSESGSGLSSAHDHSVENGHESKERKSNHAHSHGHGTNINVRAAFIHVIGDFVQSVGVLIASYVIYYKPEYKIIDPICTFLFSVLVLFTTVQIMKETIIVLMEGMPKSIKFNVVRDSLISIPGVVRIHNLRIWALTMDKIALSAHLAIEPATSSQEVLRAALAKLRSEFNVHEATLQVEEYHEIMQECHGCQEPKD